MKRVLISIRPEWVEKIASGKKTIEVRKSAPKEVPFKAYIYCTSQKFDRERLLTADKKVERRYKHCRDNGDIPLAGTVTFWSKYSLANTHVVKMKKTD